MSTNEIIIESQKGVASEFQQNMRIESESVNCTGCGAANTKQKGIPDTCEYCGSMIK